jgi:mono/diheme cytochrome c family protein
MKNIRITRAKAWAAALAGVGLAAFLPALVGAGLATSATAAAGQGPDGKALFKERCGMCHQGIGMAVNLLARRPGDTSNGLLEERKNLSAEFVFTVARTGIGNMARISRGEVSDPELAAIANYLETGKP